MRALARDDQEVRLWIRHVRFGVAISVVLPLIALTESWLSGPSSVALRRTPLFIGVILLTLPMLWAPVEKIVRHPRGRLFFDAWEAIGIAVLSGFVWMDGGAHSPYVSGYFVLLAHAALTYPPAGMMVAGLASVSAYVFVGLTGDPVSPIFLGDYAVTMVAATITCAYASYNHVQAYAQIAAYADEVEILAARDGLTNCLNRRAFHERLEAECVASSTPLALVILDVDHFKQVNDSHGHLAGDEVLAVVGSTLLVSCRPDDAAGRLGGDEFALLLPRTTLPDARTAAERICARIRTATQYGATVSVGVAVATGSTTPTKLLEDADRAVYDAKHTGRDRVTAIASAA